MKIVQILSSLSYGGAERQVWELCKRLKGDGHGLAVASIKPGGELREKFSSLDIKLKDFGIQGFHPQIVVRIADWLQQENPDIAHTHLFKADVLGGLAASRLKIPFVSTKWNEDQYLKNPVTAMIARRMANRAEKIIAVSEAVRKFFIRTAHFDSSRMIVIPIGIPLNAHFESSSPSKFLRFGIVGRLVEQKGHDLLLYAFRKAHDSVPNIRLNVFGSGRLENKLKNLAQQLQLEDIVRFYGLLLETDEIYRQLDVLVLPSRWEGAGLVILEAMVRGIPVIGSDAGGIREYLNENCGLIFQTGNAQELTEAILKIAKDKSLLDKFAENCKKMASQFDFQRTYDAHVELYQQYARKNVAGV